jgi:proteasome accessory factor C
MPKSNKITGTDRFNLLLAMVGYLMHNHEVPIQKLADQFGISVEEADSAVNTIWVSGVGNYFGGELYDFEYGQYEDGIIELKFNPGIEDVPKLSARQVATLSAGLSYLSKLPGFAEKSAVDELLEILSQGSTGAVTPIIDVTPGSVDADLLVVRKAIVENKRIRCNYRNANDETTQRDIDPLLLEAIDQVWYLRGFCHTREAVRAFRLDRMLAAEILDVEISEEARNSSLSEEIYEPKDTDTSVILDLDSEAFSIIADYQASKVEDLPNGGQRVSVKVGNLKIMGPLIAKFAGSARVVAPTEAKVIVRDFALKALGGPGLEETKAE